MTPRRFPAVAAASAFASLLLATLALADPMRPLNSGSAVATVPAPRAFDDLARRDADAAVPPAAPAIALIAIRRDSTNRWQALIGERWLGVGDALDGAAISAIDANTVRLGRGANSRLLYLLPPLEAAATPAPSPAGSGRPVKKRDLEVRTP